MLVSGWVEGDSHQVSKYPSSCLQARKNGLRFSVWWVTVWMKTYWISTSSSQWAQSQDPRSRQLTHLCARPVVQGRKAGRHCSIPAAAPLRDSMCGWHFTVLLGWPDKLHTFFVATSKTMLGWGGRELLRELLTHTRRPECKLSAPWKGQVRRLANDPSTWP